MSRTAAALAVLWLGAGCAHTPADEASSTARGGAAPAAASAAEAPPGEPTTAPAPDAAPAPPSHRIRWTTASEVDNFGFDVYRGESAEGPFVRVTPQPLAGGGTSDVPRSYEFLDTAIDPTKAYWYYVESISLSGERERFTPVQKVGPKQPPPAPATPSEPSASPPG
jgi:hypothetical protein